MPISIQAKTGPPDTLAQDPDFPEEDFDLLALAINIDTVDNLSS
ncbi:MAG TPA: hypothetical protein PKC98_15800 [Candidatus Melainabacteria bacterium]|nr:hypothetical protein [Candidatus Melainabacteria bacterium]